MSRDSALLGGALSLKPAIWLWPVAAALLAAWPVWRSMFPETPDLGTGLWRLQPALGLASAALYIAWLAKWRRFVDEPFSRVAILVTLAAGFMAVRRGDIAGADLSALMIGWMVSTVVFASLVLLKAGEAGVQAGSRPPRSAELLPPIPYIGVVIAVVILAVLVPDVISRVNAAILAAVSPGLILAWSSLSDTARAILTKRQVYFADARDLLALTKRRRWLLRAPTILVSDRVKLLSLYPAADIKPGELVGLAAAATMDEETDIGRAIQEFGVSHRIRLPGLRPARADQPLLPRQAMLANGAVVELCAIDDGLDVSAHAEAIDLAQKQHRIVMAVVERTPNPRLLGIIIFAIAARAGAAEALRILRDRRIDIVLSAPPRDAADEIALKSLRVESATFDPSKHQDIASIWRGGAEADAGDGLSVSFGGVRTKGAPSSMHLVVGREDARALVDLARFADDFRTRTLIVTLLASAPGWVLIAAALGYVPVTPFLVTGVAVIGILIATVTPQVLRLSPVLDNEGTED